MIEESQQRLIRVDGKRFTLPTVLPFNQGDMIKGDFRFYEVLGFRCPKAGEFYISGGPPQPWRAPNDLSTPFLVVKPTEKAVKVCRWVKESEVKKGGDHTVN